MLHKILTGDRNTPLKYSVIALLLILLISVQGFNSLLKFPVIGSKLQPFEIMSLVICLIAIFKWIKFSDLFTWTILDISLALHILAIQISLAFNYSETAMFESLGSIYLFTLYFILSRLFLHLKTEQVQIILKKGYFLSIIFTLASAVVGYFAYRMINTSSYVLVYPGYPYFGDVVRLSGFASSPNVLLSVLFVSCVIFFYLNKKIPIPLLVACILIAVFTLAKELFIYSVGIIYIYFTLYKNKSAGKVIILQYIFVSIIYISLFYFVFDLSRVNNSTNQNELIVGREALFEKVIVTAYPTTYYYLARAETDVIRETFPIGCGKGNFLPLINTYQTAGKYPAGMWTNEPHDVYLGAIAELGLLGLLAGLLFVYSIYYQFKKINTGNDEYKKFVMLLFLILILWSIESTGLGTLQLRHYWLLLAIFNYFWLRKKIEPQ